MIGKEVNYKAAGDLIVLSLSKARALIPEGLVAELEFHSSVLRAERHAAEQLAAVLARTKDVMVLNDVRLNHAGKMIVIDHLVLTPAVAYLVDSQTLCVNAKVNREGQWHRQMHGRMVPIATPETSMAEKAVALVDFLKRYARQFMQPPKAKDRDKAKDAPKESGNGKDKDKDKNGKDKEKPKDKDRVKGKDKDEVAERFAALYQTRQFVCMAPDTAIEGANPTLKHTKELAQKAEEVAQEIAGAIVQSKRSFWQELLARLRREPPKSLTRKEFYKMVQWLADQDQAPAPVSTVTKLLSERCRTMPPALLAAIRQVQRDASWDPEDGNAASDTLCILHFCTHCQSDDLSIAGKDGDYQFLCRKCQKLTPIEPICSDCGGVAQLTQAHRTFFVRCGDCGHERVFFVNPPETPSPSPMGGAVSGKKCVASA